VRSGRSEVGTWAAKVKIEGDEVMRFQVKYWMTPNPLIVDIDEDVTAAQEVMRQEAVSHLLVFDECKLIGVLSETDLKLIDQIRRKFNDGEAMKIKVSDLMTRHPLTVSPSSHMSTAMTMMEERKIHCLPVIDQYGDVIGILTGTDALRFALVASQKLDSKPILEEAVGTRR